MTSPTRQMPSAKTSAGAASRCCTWPVPSWYRHSADAPYSPVDSHTIAPSAINPWVNPRPGCACRRITPVRQVLSCHRLAVVWLVAARPNGKVIAAVADVAKVYELNFRPGQEFRDRAPGLPPVRDQYAVADPALPVIGPDDLLTTGELERIVARRQVARTAVRVDEHGTAFGVGTRGTRRRIGDQQQILVRP